MPFATNHGVRLHWRQDGNPASPALLLLNSLGCDLAMWDAVVPAFARHFLVLRMDTRGHGASDAPPGDYTLPMLTADALAVLDAAGAGQAHVCGLSMGGMQVQQMAQDAPDRVLRAVVCNSSSEVPAEPWQQRAATVRSGGMAAIADAVMERFFSPAFRARATPVLATARATLLATDPGGYAGCCMAIAGLAVRPGLGRITAPVLVVNGSQDVATPPEQHGARIAAAIPGAGTVVLDTGHIGVLEQPGAFVAAVLPFLRGGPDHDGMAVRREVLGDAWVDRALAGRTPLTAEFQDFITRYAWGAIWTRPGLDHRTRRLLVLAITVSLGRWEEFRLHARAGLEQDGFTVDELKEVLMQCAVYAGVPAANTAFHHAGEIVASLRPA